MMSIVYTRVVVFRVLFLCALTQLFRDSQGQTEDCPTPPGFNWDLHDRNCGPKVWAGKCQLHKGSRQSPIDINTVHRSHRHKLDLHFENYRDLEGYRETNDGKFFSITQRSSDTEVRKLTVTRTLAQSDALLDDDDCELESHEYIYASTFFLFGKRDNKGSEHALDGKKFAMEIRHLHYLSNFSSLAAARHSGIKFAVAVLTVFVEVEPSRNYYPAYDRKPPAYVTYDHIQKKGDVDYYQDQKKDNDKDKVNSELNKIAHHLEPVEEPATALVSATINLRKLIPIQDNWEATYLFRYFGSRTIPTCQETFAFYIFKKPLLISEADIRKFRDLENGHEDSIAGNLRELQENHPDLKVESLRVQTIYHC